MSASDLNLFASLAQLLGQEMCSSAQTVGPEKVTYCSATCLDQQCRNRLYFPQHEASVQCPNCGQRHSVSDLTDCTVLGEKDQRFGVEVTQLRKKYSANRKTAEQIKVSGVSNFQCKLLSPLFSTYGMGKDNQPMDLGEGQTFDCSKLANRSFSIEEKHLQVLGFGLDCSGSQIYLRDTLAQLQEVNGRRDCLVPLHADGDGHCLVHAISRCLVGRELFWHALRLNLHAHLNSYHQRYCNLFKDFYSPEEWEGLIAEAGPDWKPPDGQSLGLCNIHVYGLANVLRRPIILLDSLEGMRSSGDYSGIFLPTMFTPQECSSKDSHGVVRANSPLVIAWSSSGRNHFIPLIPVKGKPLPKLPPSLLPKVWGLEEELLHKYVEVSPDGSVEVCGGKELGERYLLRLVNCMEKLFLEKHRVSPSLVGDVDQYVFKVAGCVGVALDTTTWTTRRAVEEGRLFRCLICGALSIIPADWLKPRGMLYAKAARESKLLDGSKLTFPFDGITARYDKTRDYLVPLDVNCFCCSMTTRNVLGDGTVLYENGDHTQTPTGGSRCGCGFKHYWDGKEYDNLPEKLPVSFSWAGKVTTVDVCWFQYETDPERNSNAYQVAMRVVNNHYPGEFGSERLVQQVVDHILKITADSAGMEQMPGHHPGHHPGHGHMTTPTSYTLSQSTSHDNTAAVMSSTTESEFPPSKIILTGAKAQVLHKEELGVSEAEKVVRRRVLDNSRLAQNQSKKRTKYSESKPFTPEAIPPCTALPQAKPTHQPKSRSMKPLQKRVRVSTSDGRTCNLCLEQSVTYSQLQAAIERDLSIPACKQKLRSGFPPRELVPPDDPSLPVDLADLEKISVDIVTGTEVGPKPSLEAGQGLSQKGGLVQGLEEKGERASTNDNNTSTLEETEQRLQGSAETLNMLLQHMLGKEVDLWSVAQHQPRLFLKDGDYYQQVMHRYGTHIQDNAHIQFKELPGKTFAYNARTECLELCLGAIHVPVRPLSSEEEKLATVTAAVEESNTEEHTTSTHSSTSRTNASSNKPGRAAPHVEAFSGKGHTLSSDTHPSFNSSRPSELLRWTELPGQQRAGLERLGHIGNLGQVESTGQLNRQTDLLGQKGAQGQADLSGQAERFVEAEPPGHSELSGQAGILVQMVARKRLKVLQEQVSSLKQLVHVLNGKLVEVEGAEESERGSDVVLSLEDKLRRASNNLKKVHKEMAELATL